MQPFVQRMAQALGVDGDRLAERLRRAELDGDLLLCGSGGPAAAGNATIGRWLRGHAAPSTLGAALRAELDGIGGRLELRPPTACAGTARPRVDGLPEALFRLAEVKAAGSPRMDLSPAQPDRLRFIGAQIALRREVLAILDEFRAWLHDDLALYETQGRGHLAAGYDPVRPAAQRDRELGPALAPVEAYLHEAAPAG